MIRITLRLLMATGTVRPQTRPVRLDNSKTLIWIVDFGPDMSESEATRYEASQVFVWASPNVVSDHQLVVFARQGDYFFGVLHSRSHEVWSLRMGT
jgi:hypothetical protein